MTPLDILTELYKTENTEDDAMSRFVKKIPEIEKGRSRSWETTDREKKKLQKYWNYSYQFLAPAPNHQFETLDWKALIKEEKFKKYYTSLFQVYHAGRDKQLTFFRHLREDSKKFLHSKLLDTKKEGITGTDPDVLEFVLENSAYKHLLELALLLYIKEVFASDAPYPVLTHRRWPIFEFWIDGQYKVEGMPENHQGLGLIVGEVFNGDGQKSTPHYVDEFYY